MDADHVRSAILRSDVNALCELLVGPGVIQRLNDPEAGFLYAAVVSPNPKILKLLLDAGASPETAHMVTGTTPLLGATIANLKTIMKLLISAGADVDAINRSGITPLYACHSPEAVAILLAAGANPRLQGAEPCLIGAAVRDDADVAIALIDAVADPSAVSPRSGWTPLHAAAQNCSTKVVEALLAAGADALATDGKGKTPLRSLHSGAPRQRQAITAALVAAGDRNWAHVPMPCAGLQRALVPTWKKAPEELPQLFKRLQPEVQERARAALKIFHPHSLPVHLRMDLLSAALET